MIAKTFDNGCSYIEGFVNLRSGWDGYAADPIKDEAINKAIAMMAIFDANGVDFNEVLIYPIISGNIGIRIESKE